MNSKFPFCIIKFSPHGNRGEQVNIGLAVWNGGEIDLRIHPSRHRLGIVREYSCEHELESLKKILTHHLDPDSPANSAEFILPRWNLSAPGQFISNDVASYSRMVDSLVDELVSAPSKNESLGRRKFLTTEIREEFENLRILGSTQFDLNSGYVVPRLEIELGSKPLIIDFAAKKNHWHLLQTVDLSTSLSDKLKDISLKIVAIQRAKDVLADKSFRSFFVYRKPAESSDQLAACLELMDSFSDFLVDFRDDRQRIQLLSKFTSLRRQTGDLFIKKKPGTGRSGRYSSAG